MEERAQAVHQAYVRHARALDQRYHPGVGPVGPVRQIILDHVRVRGLAVGGYGEWNWEVEWLLEAAARLAASRDWRQMGCDSQDMAYGRLLRSYRQRLGVVAVREAAHHRYRQSQMVGLTRQQLRELADSPRQQQARVLDMAARVARSVEIAQTYVVPGFERALM